MSAITAITAQNTVGVSAIHPLPPEIVLAQVRAVLADIGVDAVKVGMLGTTRGHAGGRARARRAARRHAGGRRPGDGRRVGRAAARPRRPSGRSSRRSCRAPPCSPRTCPRRACSPDRSRRRGEAGEAPRPPPTRTPKPRRCCVRCSRSGPARSCSPAVIARTRSTSSSTAAADERIVSIPGERHPDGAAHGSGCTHSSVLAAQLALGRDAAARPRARARALAGEAVARRPARARRGRGPGRRPRPRSHARG